MKIGGNLGWILLMLLSVNDGCCQVRAAEVGIKSIDHVGISTPDIARSIRFYRDLLGMKLLEQDQIENQAEYDRIFGLKNVKAKAAVLRLGSMELELFEFQRPPEQHSDPAPPVTRPGIYHLCFAVIDIRKEYDRLKAAGVSFISAPQDFGTALAVYGRDPDGNIVELVQWRQK